MGKEKNCMKLLWDYETSMNNINFEKDANFLYCVSHNSACVCCNMLCSALVSRTFQLLIKSLVVIAEELQEIVLLFNLLS